MVAFEYASFRGSLSEVVLFTVVHRVRMGSGEVLAVLAIQKNMGATVLALERIVMRDEADDCC